MFRRASFRAAHASVVRSTVSESPIQPVMPPRRVETAIVRASALRHAPQRKKVTAAASAGAKKKVPKPAKETINLRCQHGRVRYYCVPCKGKGICEHNTRRSTCRQCVGSGICSHGLVRQRCVICNGVGMCEHGRRRETCRDCEGSARCEHNRIRATCRQCEGRNVCRHGHQRQVCRRCDGRSFCQHMRRRATCKECVGSAICRHGQRKALCNDCGGSAYCVHGTIRGRCAMCHGKSRCEHGRLRTVCHECEGGSRCAHNLLRTRCRECKGGSLCAHGRVRRDCAQCRRVAVLGNPILPMQAHAARSIAYAAARCPNGGVSERKYDGERVQIHIDGAAPMAFYSGSLKPVRPAALGDLEAHVRTACRVVADNDAPRGVTGVRSAVFDGELVRVVAPPDGRATPGNGAATEATILPRGHWASDATVAARSHVAVVLFDVLAIDGLSLIDRAWQERRAALLHAVRRVPGRVMLSDAQPVSGPLAARKAQLAARMAEIQAAGHEGLIVKHATSRYLPGKRCWVKVKGEYLAGGGATIDAVVLGVWYPPADSTPKDGMSRPRLLRPASYLLGVRDATKPCDAPGAWKTLSRVAAGVDAAVASSVQQALTDPALTWRRPTTATRAPTAHGRPSNCDEPPAWLDATHTHVPDVLLRCPWRDAPVWEVKAAAFTATVSHTAGGHTLTFPRLVQPRPDKAPLTAATVQDVQRMARTQHPPAAASSSD